MRIMMFGISAIMGLILSATLAGIYEDVTAVRSAPAETAPVSRLSPEYARESMEEIWQQAFLAREHDGKKPMGELRLARTIEHVLKSLPVDKRNGLTHTLILETARTETLLGMYAMKNRCKGAYGIFQIHEESARYVLSKSRELREAAMAFYDDSRSFMQNLEENVQFSIAVCAVYYQVHGLSKRNIATVESRAKFWKERYNTVKGKGTVERYVKLNTARA